MTVQARVITISDRSSRGQRADTSGPAVAALLATLPARVVATQVVADEPAAIRRALSKAVPGADLVVTTGGTGLGPRDVTPQTLAALLDFEVPGLGEEMRRRGRERTPHALLSRQLAGVIGSCLVLALPGSERAATESLEAIWATLPHALQILAGADGHPPGGP